jgi:hypothetical protein
LVGTVYEGFRGRTGWKKEAKAETLKHLFLTSANGNSRWRIPEVASAGGWPRDNGINGWFE